MFGLILSCGTVVTLMTAGYILQRKGFRGGRKIYATVLGLSALLVFTGAVLALFSGTSIAAACATGIACLGAGLAVANVGAAALGLVGEKPEMLGTTLIYLGLAEGIAIYGVIISLLIIQRL